MTGCGCIQYTHFDNSVVEDATIIGFAGWLGKGWITSSCLLHVYSAMEEGTQWNSLLVVKQLKAPTP